MKLAHLRQKLEGEPLELIEHISVDDDSFLAGWNILVDQFENPRLAYSAHLDKLMGQQWSDKSPPLTAKQIHRIRNDITENISALKAAGAPVSYWDSIVVFACVKRLDTKLRKEWELHLGRSADIPSLAQFRDFLLSHARALESVEIATGAPAVAKGQHSSKPKGSAKVHVAAAPRQGPSATPSGKESRTCTLCKDQHPLFACSAFLSMSVDDRSRFVSARGVCANCTSPHHQTSACKSQKNCTTCRKRHHTLLCEKTDAPTFAQAIAKGNASASQSNAYPFRDQSSGASSSK